MGKISRRPTTMHRDMVILDRGESREKFPVGPTSSSPGPTLLRLDRAEEKETEKEHPSREIISPAPRRIST